MHVLAGVEGISVQAFLLCLFTVACVECARGSQEQTLGPQRWWTLIACVVYFFHWKKLESKRKVSNVGGTAAMKKGTRSAPAGNQERKKMGCTGGGERKGRLYKERGGGKMIACIRGGGGGGRGEE